jgi:hypothetical protein
MSNCSPTFICIAPSTRIEVVEHHRAEHRALVINQRKDDGPLAVIIAQADRRAGFIAERQVSSNLRVELLVDADVVENRRVHGLRANRRCDADDQCEDETLASDHFVPVELAATFR